MSKLQKAGKETIAYQGRMLEIVTQDMSDGDKTITFEWARRAPGIRLILVDTTRHVIILTKEHRYELGTDDYRLPGGKVFDSLKEYNTFLHSGENILTPAAKKAHEEAEEEAGIIVDELKHFHTSLCGATVQWDLLYFVSEKWHRTTQKLELGEEIEVIEVPFAEAHKIALDGRMGEERSALILLRYLLQTPDLSPEA